MRADDELKQRLLRMPSADLFAEARARRDARGPARTTYSRKVFIPLTQLCADVCHYCTFAKSPRQLTSPYLSLDEVLTIARRGAALQCKEALITLGDAPERRYPAARETLASMGFERTIDYVAHAAEAVLKETGLLPHINAGVLERADYERLRTIAPSAGLMLETSSARLSDPGGPHHGSPDKLPETRLASLAAAGEARMAMTSGILVGIGETDAERIDSLIALRDLHRVYGHIQEVIIQNFEPKPGTRMADAPPADENTYLRAIAWARIILDDDVTVQAPPNLNDGRLMRLLDAGIDDWGGISPLTIDHVNPGKPWPEIERLQTLGANAGRPLAERLTIYPRFIKDEDAWLAPIIRPAVLKQSDGEGLARDSVWSPGDARPAPGSTRWPIAGLASGGASARQVDRLLSKAARGDELSESETVTLFQARGASAEAIASAADALRGLVNGEDVTYVVNRNINYSNICTYKCGFCAFSKSSSKTGHRDAPYVLPTEDIAERALEAQARGATEVCLQGGIHPSYTGQTYLAILRAIKDACPDLHVHAFSPLEVSSGARTLGLSARDYLKKLKDTGLGSLPGTAAEILADDVRARICPDKITTQEWLDVVGAAHSVGLPTTATIMFGHIEGYEHWARHLLAIRRLQNETGGFTEFVPLPFVHMEAPIYRRGLARKGPTWREAVLMHAVARLVLHGAIDSIQCSWVKLGLDGAAAVLAAGANDLGGVLMNESISRAAGAEHGQEACIADLRQIASAQGRPLRRRTTLRTLFPENEPDVFVQAQPDAPLNAAP